MKITKTLLSLSILSLLGASAYATAQHVYRAPVPATKADPSSSVQEEIERKEEEKERQEQENIDMCLNQKRWWEDRREELQRIDLNSPTLLVGVGAKKDRVGIPTQANYFEVNIGDREIYTPDFHYKPYDYGSGWTILSNFSFLPFNRDVQDYYAQYESGDVVTVDGVELLVGDHLITKKNAKLHEVSIHGSSANTVNEHVSYRRMTVLIRSEKYDWCVDNGYEVDAEVSTKVVYL